MLAVEAIRQVAGLAISRGSEYGRYPTPPKLVGPPVEVVFVGGWFSPGSGYMRNLQASALKILPDGSTTRLHTPATGINLSVGGMGIPWVLREIETRRVADRLKAGADRHGIPSIGIGHSLGGILLGEAWNQQPHEADGIVTAGSPHVYPVFGVPQRPDKGRLHTVSGSRDIIVPPWFARHSGEDSHRRVPGGHFSLTVSRPGTEAILNGLIDVYTTANPN